jgi:hypothetical protein
MKAICNVKNMMTEEFEHEMKSKLMQVARMKIGLIQCVSKMMVVQMTLRKESRRQPSLMARILQPSKGSKLWWGGNMRHSW